VGQREVAEAARLSERTAVAEAVDAVAGSPGPADCLDSP
jgi:hypothetical protein